MPLTKIQNAMMGNSSNIAFTPAVPIIENTQNVTSAYTITANNSAMSVGPVTLSANVTINSGSRWVIL